VGNSAIQAYFPDAEIVANAIAGGRASRYPAGNFFPTVPELMGQFADPATGDFRLLEHSTMRQAATDGTDLGVNFHELYLGQSGSAAPAPPTY
jgi:hypothetical protein